MIKPVSVMNSIVKTPAVRNFATATMLTLGVLGVGACAGGNSNKTAGQTQTEVVSTEGAEAIKSAAIPNQPIYSKEPNKKLTEKFCNKVKPEEVDAQMNNIYGLLDAYGTFAGAVEMQRSYNYLVFSEKLEDCIADNIIFESLKSLGIESIFSFENEEAEKFIKLENWVNDSYYATLRALEQEAYDKGKKDARFVSDMMDSHFASIDFLSKEEKKDYEKSLLKYRSKQQDKYSVQGYSDYIAFQVYTMDRIMYMRAAKNMGFDKFKGFDKVFAEFEKAAAPTP